MAVTPKALMRALIAAVAILLAATAGADDLHRFDDPALQARYSELIATLRCPKCENQAIGDSGSPIAGDMRTHVARALRRGDSDDDIRQAMVERFGDYVLYRPRLEWRTVALWAGPGVGVLLGLAAIAAVIRSRRDERAEALDDDEQQRLDTLLSRHQGNDDQDRSHQ
ncbi:cytochrome c-type biogenesis protein [Kushneria indalinina]|uniref:Cytochrome c-type biogenesis protein n=1 Tax=Kushneria indalinina DSM 14324 TaxID=1122140 RepID=A0A3D9DVK5_9GAMM|nr:cytochrome c-type biogenesis protein [Kushneria indalinina]REC94787.1 cytochrome c-type biogenesis protein CcmH [Kushneria indalinina DSM 14324]